MKKPAIFLMGPTASGKTQLAIDLLKHLPCEIISVDSALIYRGMNIGTAKPDSQTLLEAPHRLIDIRDPDTVYSAADFREDALREMAAITEAGNIPLLVGGTMLYFKCLLQGMADLPRASQEVRERIEEDAKRHGWGWVHERLAEVDPESAKRIHPNDPQRLQRAYEIFLSTGKTMTALWAEQADMEHDFPYQAVQLAITPTERSELHRRIALRFHQMLEQGFIDEVVHLRQQYDLNLRLPSMRAVGYRQVWEHIDGVMDYDQMAERGIIATRQLAKRQLTWLRSWQNLYWLATDSNKIVDNALKNLKANAISAS